MKTKTDESRPINETLAALRGGMTQRHLSQIQMDANKLAALLRRNHTDEPTWWCKVGQLVLSLHDEWDEVIELPKGTNDG